MWGKVYVSKFLNVLGRGLVRWLEILGENPPLSREHGFYAWRHLRQCADEERAARWSVGVVPDGACGLRMDEIEDRVRHSARPSASQPGSIREAGPAASLLASLPPRRQPPAARPAR